MAAERPDRTYRFDPVDSSGIFLGLGAVQCTLLGAGLLAGVGAITAGLPVLVAAVPVVGGAVASFARIGGYAAWEWLPLGATWLGVIVGGAASGSPDCRSSPPTSTTSHRRCRPASPT